MIMMYLKIYDSIILDTTYTHTKPECFKRNGNILLPQNTILVSPLGEFFSQIDFNTKRKLRKI